MTDIPIKFRREGEVLRPLDRFRPRFDEEFKDGEIYGMVIEGERSEASNRHFFAVLHTAFLNLPETCKDSFLTQEHLRKWALIVTGHANEEQHPYQTIADAAHFVEYLRRKGDPYAVVEREGTRVRVRTAKSIRRMNKQEYQQMKDDVFGYLAHLLGVTVDELTTNAGQAA